MTDNTEAREYQVRLADGDSLTAVAYEDASTAAARLGGKVYARTVTTTVSATAWAEVIR